MTPPRRLLAPLSAVALALCVVLWGVSLWEAMALQWGRESVAVTGGVAVYYHSRAGWKPPSFLHARYVAGRDVPGGLVAGFHFLRDTSGRRTAVLVGVPMWFPTSLSAGALLLALRPRRRAATQGFAVNAAVPPTGQAPAAMVPPDHDARPPSSAA